MAVPAAEVFMSILEEEGLSSFTDCMMNPARKRMVQKRLNPANKQRKYGHTPAMSAGAKRPISEEDDEIERALKIVESGGARMPSCTRGKDNQKKKGLRDFTLLVCERLRHRRVTSYTEISDDLVANMFSQKDAAAVEKNSEAKNIRRRVYDALNVLVAIGAITKNKKELVWQGLPNPQPLESERLRQLRDERRASIQSKKDHLSQLMCQYVARRNISTRNAARQQRQLSGDFLKEDDSSARLHLPFLVLSVPHDSVFSGDMDASRENVTFTCSHPITLNEHDSVLAMLGGQTVSPWYLPRIVPRELTPFYPEQCKSASAVFGEPKVQVMPWKHEGDSEDA